MSKVNRHKSPNLSGIRKKKQFEEITSETPSAEKYNEISVYKLVSHIFGNNVKKEELIKKHRPCFSLKVIPNQEIEKVYSSIEIIPVEKIQLVEEFKYEEEIFESKNLFETNSKSFGLSSFNVDLSLNIFGHKQNANYQQQGNNYNLSSISNSKIYCMHTIIISLFRTIIDFKDIKLAKQINEELKIVENANATERKKLLETFIDKFGLYIPLELVIGGRMNISFVANSEHEINLCHDMIQKDLGIKVGGGFSFLSGNLDIDYKNQKKNEKNSQSLNNVKNMTTKIIGGDYLFRKDLDNWIKSFNIDNLQVIEYKNLIPIYSFIPGFENKLQICLKSYEEIVLQQIYDLIENDFKNAEQNLFEGSSLNFNSWNVGLTNGNYKSFQIFKQSKEMNIIITKSKDTLKKIKNDFICEKEMKLGPRIFINEKENTLKENNCINKDEINIIHDCEQLYIYGEVPKGSIICGWDISTDVNSKPYDIICTWKRKKGLKIIGSRFFKFKLDINLSEIKNLIKILKSIGFWIFISYIIII